MFRIRYYDQFIHPDTFAGKGWRGLVIRMLNWVRWKLETAVQRRVLNLYMREIGDLQKGKALRRILDLDVQAERLEKERTSPKQLPIEDYEMPTEVLERGSKYLDGAVKTKFESGEDRPKPIDDLAERYGGTRRQVRYSRGRKFTLLDPDGDFEPISNVRELVR